LLRIKAAPLIEQMSKDRSAVPRQKQFRLTHSGRGTRCEYNHTKPKSLWDGRHRHEG
jgi:hypothetical protein